MPDPPDQVEALRLGGVSQHAGFELLELALAGSPTRCFGQSLVANLADRFMTSSKVTKLTRLDQVIDALEHNRLGEIHALLHELHSAEIANLLESLPLGDRDVVWEFDRA